jgi:hypothetical protein
MNRYIFISVLSILFSCNQKGEEFNKKGEKLYKYDYYSNKKIRSISIYNNDTLLDGVQTFLYPSGDTQRTINWIRNKKVGEELEYYRTGTIKDYSFYNLNQKKIYERSYDSSGKLTEEVGEISPLIFLDRDTFDKHKTLLADIYSVHPPHTDVKYSFYLIKGKDTLPITYTNLGNKILVREREKNQLYNEFAVKYFISDSSKMKKWDQMDVISLKDF